MAFDELFGIYQSVVAHSLGLANKPAFARHLAFHVLIEQFLPFMFPQRSHHNRNRRIKSPDLPATEASRLAALGEKAKYKGSGLHKRNPGDFGLAQPGQPRQGKTLCDDAGITSKAEAEGLLKKAFARGMVSMQERSGWPQHVWAVYKGIPMEAQRERDGVYHGYPLAESDPLREEILRRWS